MTRFDAPTLARAWLAVRQATATKDDAAALTKTVAIEEFTRGVRLVSTDRFMLLTAWVPSLDASRRDEPGLDEAPDRTVIAQDPDGRCKSLMGYILTLARRMELDDLPAGALECRVDFDVKIPAGDDVPETFEGLEPTYVVFVVPDVERVHLPVVEAAYPDWRGVRHGFVARPAAQMALSPDLITRVAGAARWAFPPLHVTFGGDEKVMAVDYPESDPHVTGFLMPRRWVLEGEPDPEDETDTDDGDDAPEPDDEGVSTAVDALSVVKGGGEGGPTSRGMVANIHTFRDAIHEGAASLGASLRPGESFTVETPDGRSTEVKAAHLHGGDCPDECPDPDDAIAHGFGDGVTLTEGDEYIEPAGRLYCPTCPRIVEVSPEDQDASLSEIRVHVQSHGFTAREALEAIHADPRNVPED